MGSVNGQHSTGQEHDTLSFPLLCCLPLWPSWTVTVKPSNLPQACQLPPFLVTLLSSTLF